MKTLTWENKSYNVSIEKIDAITAEKYLENLGEERPISQICVSKLVNKHKAGHWINLNGDTICFDEEDKLVDGQHRMTMIVKTGIPIVTFVIRGVDKEIYFGKDKGKSRSLKDTLSMKGVKYASETATILRYLWLYKYKALKELGWWGMGGHTASRFDDFIAWELFQQHPNLSDSILYSNCRYRKQSMPFFKKSFLGFFSYLLPRISEQDGLTFIETLTEIKSKTDTPMEQLIKRVTSSYKPNFKDKISLIDLFAMTIKTWNCFILGQRIDSIRAITWKYNETFPEIKNEENEIVFYNDVNWNIEIDYLL